MTIVTYTHRYKRPPRKRKAVALEAPAGVTGRTRKPEPVAVTAPPLANDGEASEPPAIVTTTNRKHKRRIADGPPLPMELPLSRRPVERAGDDYKRLKATMARRLRGDDE